MLTIRVKMNDTEYTNAMAIIEAWEKDPKYCDLAADRIKQYVSSPKPVSLFEFAATAQLA